MSNAKDAGLVRTLGALDSRRGMLNDVFAAAFLTLAEAKAVAACWRICEVCSKLRNYKVRARKRIAHDRLDERCTKWRDEIEDTQV